MPNPSALLACVHRWGRHSLAYAILQPGMAYFGDADTGVIAYRRVWGQTIVLADPVAPLDEVPALLDQFLAEHRRAVFMQVSTRTATLLKARGFAATPVGVENTIPLDSYTLTGRRKQDLRHYRNKAQAAGLEVREETDSAMLRAELKPVSDSWLPTKSWHARELEFLARPFLPQPEPGVRIFTARRDGRVAGFVVLDPMHDDGHCIGYGVTILRHGHGAPEGTVDYINLCAMQQLHAEGLPTLSLGVSPFHRLEDLAQEHGKGLPTAYLAFLLMRRFGNPIYHFRGLSFHKSRYRAQESPVFTCLSTPLGALPLIASARACRMI